FVLILPLAWGLSSPTSPAGQVGQSQRDCVLQPRIASLRATLGNNAIRVSTPTGLWLRWSPWVTPPRLHPPSPTPSRRSVLAATPLFLPAPLNQEPQRGFTYQPRVETRGERGYAFLPWVM